MKKAFLVLGPESSGTRFITKLLIDAGCFGDGDHEQRLDKKQDATRELLDEALLPKEERPIVWRRSFPHGEKWVDISKAVKQLRDNGYQVHAVVTTRDWFATIQSQIKEHSHVTDKTVGIQNVQRAYQEIFEHLPEDVPFVMASYDSITRYGWKAVLRLLEMLDLIKPRLITTITEGNAKWYED